MTAAQRGSRLGRYLEIVRVLSAHGLRYAGASWPGKKRKRQATKPVLVRSAMESLGITFIKIGQMLSTRPDLLSREYRAELARLQDRAIPVDVEVVKETIAQELGKPIGELFATFEDEPLAAASIGQVHGAVLHDGTEVIVKVRRPNAVEQVALDLEIMERLARRAMVSSEWARLYDLPALVREFGEILKRELDYRLEINNAERFVRAFAGSPAIRVPRVFREYSTARVLTMERVRGMKPTDSAALDSAKVNRRKVAQAAVAAMLKMVFEDHFFHADPHPGNFFIHPDGTITLIDFGMVGVIDDETITAILDLVLSIIENKPDRAVDALGTLGITSPETVRAVLVRDVSAITDAYLVRGVEQISMSDLAQDIYAVARAHRLTLPANLALLLKTLVMAEGVGRELDPTLNLVPEIRSRAVRLLAGSEALQRQQTRLFQAGREILEFGLELPAHLRRIFADLERGGIGINVRHTGLDEAMRRVERAINRLIAGALASAFLVGLAVIVSVGPAPARETWGTWFFALGLVALGFLGAYTLWRLTRPNTL
jgi:ubiquinone biosynthesis protein